MVRNYTEFQQFLEAQLQSFDASIEGDTTNLCIMLTLVIESAPKGFRDIDGTTQLHINQNIITYCYDSFIKNLLNKIFNKNIENPHVPIERKANIVEILTTLRFIFYFRIYLPPADLTLIIRLCCSLHTDNDSLKEVLLLMVNAVLNLRHGNFTLYKDFKFYFNDQNIQEVASDIIKFISARDSEDNVLKLAVARLLHSTIKIMKGNCIDLYENQLSPLVISMLQKTDQFDFNCVLHLFEAIGYLAYWLCLAKSQYARSL